MPKRGLVIVVVGASSGLGRAIAQALAKDGAHLLLAARSADALEETAQECRALGASRALWRAVDIRDEADVMRLGDEAMREFGRLDVWINCVAQLVLGKFENVPAEAFRSAIETNAIGTANGARTALRLFRNQGSGHLINIGSVLGRVPEPMTSAYAASKFAVDGLTTVLQQEFTGERNIFVSLALPWALDTPIYQRAANFSGKAVRAIFPVYDPVRAAKGVRRLIARPRKQAVIGAAGLAALFGLRLSRKLALLLAAKAGPAMQFGNDAADANWGAIHDTDAPHAISGGWRRYWRAKLFRRSGKSAR